MTSSVVVLALGALYSMAVLYFAKPLSMRLGVMDHPGGQHHKKHRIATPLVGGIATIPPVVATLANEYLAGGHAESYRQAMIALAFATAASFVVGLMDDRAHIAASKRLLMCAAVFLVTILIAPEFTIIALSLESLGIRFELGLLSLPFSVLCLLAFQNAVNMADGRNGLVAGLAIIWVVAMLSFGYHPLDSALVALLCGLLLVLAANLRGRLFLGDAGTYGLGALIGLGIIWMHRSNFGLQTLDVAIILAIPAFDMVRLFVFRILSGKSPFQADHDHLHHYIDDAIGWRRGLFLYYALQALPILAARSELLSKLAAFGLACALYVAALAGCSILLARRQAAG